jgi:hypothetical protein
MTAQDVLTLLRKSLADTNPAQVRWTDYFLLQYISEGLFATYKIRPDLFLAADVITAPTALIATTDSVPLDDEYADMLSCYGAYRALMEDNADAGNVTQANVFKQMYTDRISI